MRWFTCFVLVLGLAAVSHAHHPDRKHHPVWPRIDLIPPLGYNLPMEYRRRFNRPTKIGGWIAYQIEPTSQEAMAWHDATHQRAYKDHRGRLEKHFFYPKPWEGLKIGPRISTTAESQQEPPAVTEALSEAVDAQQEAISEKELPLDDRDRLLESPPVEPQRLEENLLELEPAEPLELEPAEPLNLDR